MGATREKAKWPTCYASCCADRAGGRTSSGGVGPRARSAWGRPARRPSGRRATHHVALGTGVGSDQDAAADALDQDRIDRAPPPAHRKGLAARMTEDQEIDAELAHELGKDVDRLPDDQM